MPALIPAPNPFAPRGRTPARPPRRHARAPSPSPLAPNGSASPAILICSPPWSWTSRRCRHAPAPADGADAPPQPLANAETVGGPRRAPNAETVGGPRKPGQGMGSGCRGRLVVGWWSRVGRSVMPSAKKKGQGASFTLYPYH